MARFKRIDRNAPMGALRDLVDGLGKLEFTENFDAFLFEGTIAAGTESKIRNRITNGIPSGRVVFGHSGGGTLVDGPTVWDLNFVYIKNTGGTDAVVKILFFR